VRLFFFVRYALCGLDLLGVLLVLQSVLFDAFGPYQITLLACLGLLVTANALALGYMLRNASLSSSAPRFFRDAAYRAYDPPSDGTRTQP
jgi:hypothetical protein